MTQTTLKDNFYLITNMGMVWLRIHMTKIKLQGILVHVYNPRTRRMERIL